MESKKYIVNYSKLINTAKLGAKEKNYLINMLNGDFSQKLTKETMDQLIEVAMSENFKFITRLIKLRDKCK